ncbi:MAG: hypothetical protein Q8P67_17850 [archaeon]|nr:hypothetical protein [archaeon]
MEKQQSSNHRAPSFPADQPIFPHPIPRRNDAGGSRDAPGRESANGSGRHPIAGQLDRLLFVHRRRSRVDSFWGRQNE